MCTGGLYVNGGKLNVESPEDTVYVNGEYKQTGGDVTLKAGKNCIAVRGRFSSVDGRGVQVLGGNLTMETTSSNKFGIQAGNDGDPCDIVINTSGKVKIKVPSYIGIILLKNSSLDMKNGTLQIESKYYGVYVNGGNASPGSKVKVSGGETEITATNSYAISVVNATDKTINYGEEYFHKNYQGTAQSSRQEVSDSAILSESGTSNKYVLITPAYKIDYTLYEGSLPEGVTNPDRYSRVDNFTLNNPTLDDATFIGWTGTGLTDPTQEVTVPLDGVTGPLSFVANYVAGGGGTLVPVDVPPAPSLTYNGKEQTGYASTDQYTVENGSATNAGTYTAVVTPKDGYCWEDGSTGPKEFEFTVKKAKLTATYPGETIQWYDTPKLKVKVTGFVGGETASTAAGYKAPAVKKPKTSPHKTYKLKPSGGAADNYTFVYKAGTLTVKCKSILLLKATTKGRNVTLTWNKVNGATMFKIYKAPCGPDFKYFKTIKSGKTLKYTIKGLKKKPYKFYVVAYRVANGKTIKLATSEGAHTIVANSVKGKANTSKITVNKKSLTIKKGKTAKIKAEISCKKGKKPLWKNHDNKVRYYSSDVHIAKVDKKGKIKGMRKGKCKVYAVALNGLKATVSVTVK